MSSNYFSSSGMQKTVIILAFLALAAIFLSSVWNRMQSPSLVIETGIQQADREAMTRIAALMQEVERDPENVHALTELAGFFMRNQEWDRAWAFWKRILTIEPENRLALNQAGFAMFRMGNISEAADIFKRLLEIDPDNYHGHFNLAVIYKYYLDEQERAEDHLEKILEINPDNPELLERVRRELDSPASEEAG